MTAFDLYEMIVGEGGIDPQYFLHRMEWWEVNRYLAGIRRRYHGQWETTRALQWWLARMFGDSKKGIQPRNPSDLYKFPWEKDAPQEEITDEEIAALQAELEAWGAAPIEEPAK